MEQGGQQRAELASMAGIVERLAGELALAEEPARFIAALEGEEDARPDVPGEAGQAPVSHRGACPRRLRGRR